tara:strand:+ start:58 stop:525 length:468 start_codon:yes stop_codon:yes gene_type:complete
VNKKIIYKVKEIKRKHSEDPRIDIEETVLQLVKTIGFNFVGEKQDNIGYIWQRFCMIHNQKYKERFLDSWISKDEEPEAYKARGEDFKKLVKDKDVSDDDIAGPYDRDEHDKKLIGDVIEHWHCEETMGRKQFNILCRNADRHNFLIEIIYPDED